MLSIRKLLGWEKSKSKRSPRGADSAETETVRRIVESLEQMEPKRARHLAAFAYLLSRVAHADLEISGEETRAMEQIVAERGGLPPEQAILVVQMAKTQSRLFGGTENFLVTREFNKITTREEKLALLDCLYAVSSADKSISTVEDHEIRNIAREMLLSHQDLVEARLAHREHLAVLKRPPKS